MIETDVQKEITSRLADICVLSYKLVMNIGYHKTRKVLLSLISLSTLEISK